MTTPRRFNDWPSAFIACRAEHRPITVAVNVGRPGSGSSAIEVARITPRGRCRHVRYEERTKA